MKLNVGRYGFQIVPESEEDTAYIEDVLGLRHEDDSILLIRRNAMGLDSMGSLEANRS